MLYDSEFIRFNYVGDINLLKDNNCILVSPDEENQISELSKIDDLCEKNLR